MLKSSLGLTVASFIDKNCIRYNLRLGIVYKINHITLLKNSVHWKESMVLLVTSTWRCSDCT